MEMLVSAVRLLKTSICKCLRLEQSRLEKSVLFTWISTDLRRVAVPVATGSSREA